MTLTDSPIANWARLGARTATSRCSSRSTSAWVSGIGSLDAPTKPVTPGRALDDLPGVLVEVHVDQHVAGHGALLDGDLLVVLHLLDGLRRDDDLAHGALLAERDDAVLEVLLDLVLVPGVGVDDVPAKHGFLDLRARGWRRRGASRWRPSGRGSRRRGRRSRARRRWPGRRAGGRATGRGAARRRSAGGR